jgi:hypothetical protein
MTLPIFRTAAVALVLGSSPALAQDTILNVSYDIGREVFEALNARLRRALAGDHGPHRDARHVAWWLLASGAGVLEGLPADVGHLQPGRRRRLVEGGLSRRLARRPAERRLPLLLRCGPSWSGKATRSTSRTGTTRPRGRGAGLPEPQDQRQRAYTYLGLCLCASDQRR